MFCSASASHKTPSQHHHRKTHPLATDLDIELQHSQAQKIKRRVIDVVIISLAEHHFQFQKYIKCGLSSALCWQYYLHWFISSSYLVVGICWWITVRISLVALEHFLLFYDAHLIFHRSCIHRNRTLAHSNCRSLAPLSFSTAPHHPHPHPH